MFSFLKKKFGGAESSPDLAAPTASTAPATPAVAATPAQTSARADRANITPATPPTAPPDTPPSSASAEAEADSGERKLSWKERLKNGLSRTRNQLTGLFSRAKIDDELLEDLEATLLMADVGVEGTQYLLQELKQRVKRERLESPAQLQAALTELLENLLQPLESPLNLETHKPFVIMLAGVNGAGKTTSIGKLARHFQAQGKSVLLAAGDTFRAAAREQLVAWGERNNVAVIAQESADPAAVVFDAINAAKARGIDVVLADTAGRLPTQLHLMEEIAKVKRVIQKVEPSAPHEVLLVLDANIGQNALAQVSAFDKAVGVTGLIVTKLDGTAKGGVIAAIARQQPTGKPLALRYIGVGESLEDLQPFVAREFAQAMFASSAS